MSVCVLYVMSADLSGEIIPRARLINNASCTSAVISPVGLRSGETASVDCFVATAAALTTPLCDPRVPTKSSGQTAVVAVGYELVYQPIAEV